MAGVRAQGSSVEGRPPHGGSYLAGDRLSSYAAILTEFPREGARELLARHFNVAVVGLRFHDRSHLRMLINGSLVLSGVVHFEIGFTAGPTRGPKIVVPSRLGAATFQR